MKAARMPCRTRRGYVLVYECWVQFATHGHMTEGYYPKTSPSQHDPTFTVAHFPIFNTIFPAYRSTAPYRTLTCPHSISTDFADAFLINPSNIGAPYARDIERNEIELATKFPIAIRHGAECRWARGGQMLKRKCLCLGSDDITDRGLRENREQN